MGFLPDLYASEVKATGKRAGDAHTNVRQASGREAICTTVYSYGLDESGGFGKDYVNREAVAQRIALCWNACRHLSNRELEKMIADASQKRD